MRRADIVDAARCLIGTPFRHQGRTPGWALDCAGLVVHVASVFELDYFDQAGYSRHPSDGLLEAALDGQPCLARVALDAIKPGDVLLMKFDSDPQHLAIYAGFNPAAGSETIIHAEIRARKVCEHGFNDQWRGFVVRAYRFTGAEA
jgi:cell wall-associated NlpC family hydrolase